MIQRPHDRIEDDDQERGDRSEEEGYDPPQEAAASFRLSQAGIDQRKSSPADEVIRVFGHVC